MFRYLRTTLPMALLAAVFLPLSAQEEAAARKVSDAEGAAAEHKAAAWQAVIQAANLVVRSNGLRPLHR